MKIRSNRRKRRRYGRGRSDRKVFYARAGLAALLLLTIVLILRSCISKKQGEMRADVDASRPEIDVQLLDINEYSRPGISKRPGITGNRDSLLRRIQALLHRRTELSEGLRTPIETSASSNFVVGTEGESFSVCPHGRWHMHPTSGIRIPFRSNAVIRTKQESLQKKPISRWCS